MLAIVLVVIITIIINSSGRNRIISSQTGSDLADSSSFVSIRTPSGVIRALIASTSAEQTKGLGQKDSLPADEGLLFIFPQQGSYGFWMKDMKFPIDIIWINEDRSVAGISDNISPLSYPATYFPPKPILYVLEINAASAGRYGIATGTKLAF